MSKGFWTKNFEPGNATLMSSITDSDPASPTYNLPTITDFINKNIFTIIPINNTTTETITIPATGPSIFTLSPISSDTSETILDSSSG